jgi:hypothetical protein
MEDQDMARPEVTEEQIIRARVIDAYIASFQPEIETAVGRRNRLRAERSSKYVPKPKEETNREQAKHDLLFRKACELAGVEPTRRQFSKWTNKRGRAYMKRFEARGALSARTILAGDSDQ